MKNQNPQEILNEILLRMKYDLSKTLTENKVLIEQMSDYYYDMLGNLKLEPVNKTKMPASQLYPNIKNGQYPKTIPSSDYDKKSALNTWYSSAALRKSIQQTPKPTTTKQSMISPQNYVPTSTTPEGRKKELEWYSTKYMSNQNPKVVKDPGPRQNFDELAKQGNVPKTIDEIKMFQDFLDLYYADWLIINNEKSNLNKDITKGYGIFGPNTKRMWNNSEVQKKYEKYLYGELKAKDKNKGMISPENFVPINMDNYQDELRQYVQNYSNVDYEKIQQSLERNLAIKKEFQELRKGDRIDITVGIGSSSWDIQIPESSTLYYWTYEDHNYFEKFKNSVVFKSGSAEDWKNYLFPFGDTVTPNGEFYGTTPWKRRYMPVGKLKGFSFKTATQTWTFKQSLTSEEFLEEFGTIIDGNYVKYNWTNFYEKTWWEDWGPTILNVGSLALAFFPATWPLLLISAGMDIAAAKMQYDQGQTEGAKLSVLLSLTPFIGKLAFKVDKVMAKNLIDKFSGAVTKSDVEAIVNTLSKSEADALKSLRELGDLKSEVSKVVSKKEVKDAINQAAKKAPGLGKTAIKKGGLEISLAASTLYGMWDNIKKELSDEKTSRIQIINSIFTNISKLPIFAEAEKGILQQEYTQSYTVDSKNKLRQHINERLKIVEDKKKEIEAQAQKELDEERKKITEDFLKGFEIWGKVASDTVQLIYNENSDVKNQNDKNILDNIKK